MQTEERMVQTHQKKAKAERQLAIQKMKNRKIETRTKIELGGLVIKAKMHRYPKSIILGALVEAAQNLNRDENFKNILQIKGDAIFMGRE